jgi:hypothetical protein
MSTTQTTETRYSVYFALGGATALGIADLAINHSIQASREIVIALITFAGARQIAKSVFKI